VLARQSAMVEMLDGPVLAGFCLSLVGLKFPSGHCLSDEVATTTIEGVALYPLTQSLNHFFFAEVFFCGNLIPDIAW
jgi:hypothetical protein